MTSAEAREIVESLRQQKRREAYIKESMSLLLYTGTGGLRRRIPYRSTKTIIEIKKDSRGSQLTLL
jgi:hypothetical protein